MVFASLPQNIQIAIYHLTTDEEFQKRFGDDKVLDQLDDLKYDPFIEYCELQLLMHNKLSICNVELEPLTLSLWAYLYTIKSPIVNEEQNITNIDLDLFFYLLQTKNFECDISELLVNSMNYCKEKMNITLDKAIEIFKKLLKVNFRVLNMFPRFQAQRRSVFNADWMTSIVTKVSKVSSYSTQQLYKQISFCEMYYLFAQYCRENGSEAIYLRTEEEIQKEIDLRSTELVVDRLIEKHVIEEKDRDYYIKQIHVIKEKE